VADRPGLGARAILGGDRAPRSSPKPELALDPSLLV